MRWQVIALKNTSKEVINLIFLDVTRSFTKLNNAQKVSILHIDDAGDQLKMIKEEFRECELSAWCALSGTCIIN